MKCLSHDIYPISVHMTQNRLISIIFFFSSGMSSFKREERSGNHAPLAYKLIVTVGVWMRPSK